MADMGYTALAEFRLGNGRRADLAGVDAKGGIMIVEIKSSLADFRTDGKWHSYLGFCDRFYFAVADGFPRQVLETSDCAPERTGLIVADAFSGAIVRDAACVPLAGARRRAELIRFARVAAERLRRLVDPAP